MNMFSNYILDEQKNPIAVPDTDEGRQRYYAFRENFDNMRVARTDIVGGGYVSTVFLGLDHQFGDGIPVLWETMVFDVPGFEYEMERYTSHADAVVGHAAMVKRVTPSITLRVLRAIAKLLRPFRVTVVPK